MKSFISILFTSVVLLIVSNQMAAQPQVCFTFDDGSTNQKGPYEVEQWNQMILDKLASAQVKATFFTNGKNLQGEKGKYVFESWDKAGHQIANHTYSHPNYNSEKVTIQEFKAEILQQDAIIKNYENYTQYFRFPYLKEGNTPIKINEMRSFLSDQGYQNGHVTIDDWDWYIDNRLAKRIDSVGETKVDMDAYRTFYVNHIFEVAQRSEALAYKLTGRNIKHVLLLHHNLVNALFLDSLMDKFQQEGWKLISSHEAYLDPIYKEVPDIAGNGLLGAIAIDQDLEVFVQKLNETYNQYLPKSMTSLGL